jgi:hypothetical protein
LLFSKFQGITRRAGPDNLELNKENLDLVLSESELIKTDTVSDNKFKNGIIIQVYLLKYKGK